MGKIVSLVLVFSLLLPSYAICGSNEDVLAKIEERMMARDYKSAKEILQSSPICEDRELYISIMDEVDAITDYAEKCSNFFALAATPGEENNAIANYELLVKAYDFLPDNLHFSEKYIGFINSAFQDAEKYVQKECGNDYGQIRAGMKLSRVQKCVGEFFLHGQVKGKYGLVDYYTRGDTYLYVKNGRVVAWGE